MTAYDQTIEGAMIALYQAWNRANGLHLGSADEHLSDPTLTREQREWLRCYVLLWDVGTDPSYRPSLLPF